MTKPLYAFATETFAPMLRNLSAFIDKGAAHAAATGIDPAALASARLAADMLPLTRQVQIACDHAKHAASRLTGQAAPAFEDTETSLDELKARIAKTLDYLASVPETAFAGAEARVINVPGPAGMTFEMNGLQYLRDWAMTNFYFHVVTAYDILRHNGVALGKQDFLTHVGAYIRPTAAA